MALFPVAYFNFISYTTRAALVRRQAGQEAKLSLG